MSRKSILLGTGSLLLLAVVVAEVGFGPLGDVAGQAVHGWPTPAAQVLTPDEGTSCGW